MNDCPFCQIVSGKSPAFMVYDDDRFMAFLDIRPWSRGHTLVIPRQHARWVDDVPDFGAYFEVARKVSTALKRGLGAERIQYFTIGDVVFHAHIHVIPRYPGDRGLLPRFPGERRFGDREMREMAERLRKKINKE
ncbi:MAG: hypothetical protein A2900_04855 [Candidatus Chisholmbacteria bacterium RIFCSPLOWO2_01_FULL_50_28]|uniref:HIT domain-containing protein n=1 Tax=Candidatus Chisholmbacteria bacterium RIFCSPHIGHO2_01_FULL_52_32 TaxID=1797591 RepID=A0A1G1VSA3_9BACT|nr:MAG: hypothetical protein A2786_01890 [Candidatus Chisholmbacteria bacterium RIFCSPHIGHO2_01_FULL_52_32]OGY20377.1 MAG: hypothetical protein A2900_04855 [Candidatus Chisholmbacteria bacterium RIFCSPLOWO2_01_FULL_50_28]